MILIYISILSRSMFSQNNEIAVHDISSSDDEEPNSGADEPCAAVHIKSNDVVSHVRGSVTSREG